MRRTSIVFALCLLLTLATGCPQKNLSKQKSAVFDIQKTVDGFKDSIPTLRTAGMPEADIRELVTQASAINKANSGLIDAAWAQSGDLQAKLDADTAAIDAFINSGVVIKNKSSQAAIQSLVDALAKDLAILKGK